MAAKEVHLFRIGVHKATAQPIYVIVTQDTGSVLKIDYTDNNESGKDASPSSPISLADITLTGQAVHLIEGLLAKHLIKGVIPGTNVPQSTENINMATVDYRDHRTVIKEYLGSSWTDCDHKSKISRVEAAFWRAGWRVDPDALWDAATDVSLGKASSITDSKFWIRSLPIKVDLHKIDPELDGMIGDQWLDHLGNTVFRRGVSCSKKRPRPYTEDSDTEEDDATKGKVGKVCNKEMAEP